jgi:hypothetical protein
VTLTLAIVQSLAFHRSDLKEEGEEEDARSTESARWLRVKDKNQL